MFQVRGRTTDGRNIRGTAEQIHSLDALDPSLESSTIERLTFKRQHEGIRVAEPMAAPSSGRKRPSRKRR